MVQQISRDVGEEREAFHVCEECGFAYHEKEWAQKCEEWCAKSKSCNLEIIKHAVSLIKLTPA